MRGVTNNAYQERANAGIKSTVLRSTGFDPPDQLPARAGGDRPGKCQPGLSPGKGSSGENSNGRAEAALEEAEGLYGQCLEQILWFSYPRGLCLCFRQFYRREAGAQPFRQEVEEAAYGTPPRNPWVSAAYRKAKERAGQLLETLAAQVGEADRTHVDAVTVAWEAWMRAFFRHACYLGYRSGLFCLEQASLDQGLPEMMEQVIRTEYALGITLPQCQQELHRELRMRHRKDPSPEPSTEDGERKRQGQTDSLTGLPHLVEGMPAEKQKTFRELVGEILELCNP